MDRRILIEGPFTDAEIAELAIAVRKIEQRKSTELFTFLVLDTETTKEQAQKILEHAFPADEIGVAVGQFGWKKLLEAARLLHEGQS